MQLAELPIPRPSFPATAQGEEPFESRGPAARRHFMMLFDLSNCVSAEIN